MRSNQTIHNGDCIEVDARVNTVLVLWMLKCQWDDVLHPWTCMYIERNSTPQPRPHSLHIGPILNLNISSVLYAYCKNDALRSLINQLTNSFLEIKRDKCCAGQQIQLKPALPRAPYQSLIYCYVQCKSNCNGNRSIPTFQWPSVWIEFTENDSFQTITTNVS